MRVIYQEERLGVPSCLLPLRMLSHQLKSLLFCIKNNGKNSEEEKIIYLKKTLWNGQTDYGLLTERVTTLIASDQKDRKGIGIDVDPTYFDLAIKRITRECNLNQLTFDDSIAKETGDIKIKSPALT